MVAASSNNSEWSSSLHCNFSVRGDIHVGENGLVEMLLDVVGCLRISFGRDGHQLHYGVQLHLSVSHDDGSLL